MGYHDALRLGAWTMHAKPFGPQATVHAKVVWLDPFWATQGPQDLYLDMGRAWWRWRRATVSGGEALIIAVEGDPDIVEGV